MCLFGASFALQFLHLNFDGFQEFTIFGSRKKRWNRIISARHFGIKRIVIMRRRRGHEAKYLIQFGSM